jgi:hypothetical protein
MGIIRIANLLPEIYNSESRDFQLFTHILDLVQNSIKFDIDHIIKIINTEEIPSEYLDNLQTKVGFLTNNTYTEGELRFILSAFPWLIKYKGSKQGIIICVNAFLKARGVHGTPLVEINNHPDYTIKIGISADRIDTTLLEDVLSYVVPSGYLYEIYFYKDTKLPNVSDEFNLDVYANSTTTGAYYIADEKPSSETIDSILTENTIDADKYYNTVGVGIVNNKEEKVDE